MILFVVLIIVLLAIMGVLFWILYQKYHMKNSKTHCEISLQHQVEALELNLQKTLEIMQDLAKKMQVQQEVLDHTQNRLKQIETQNADLVALVAEVACLKEKE